jgi:hypothetical protein
LSLVQMLVDRSEHACAGDTPTPAAGPEQATKAAAMIAAQNKDRWARLSIPSRMSIPFARLDIFARGAWAEQRHLPTGRVGN